MGADFQAELVIKQTTAAMSCVCAVLVLWTFRIAPKWSEEFRDCKTMLFYLRFVSIRIDANEEDVNDYKFVWTVFVSHCQVLDFTWSHNRPRRAKASVAVFRPPLSRYIRITCGFCVSVATVNVVSYSCLESVLLAMMLA
jgi:hypothetical protein